MKSLCLLSAMILILAGAGCQSGGGSSLPSIPGGTEKPDIEYPIVPEDPEEPEEPDYEVTEVGSRLVYSIDQHPVEQRISWLCGIKNNGESRLWFTVRVSLLDGAGRIIQECPGPIKTEKSYTDELWQIHVDPGAEEYWSQSIQLEHLGIINNDSLTNNWNPIEVEDIVSTQFEFIKANVQEPIRLLPLPIDLSYEGSTELIPSTSQLPDRTVLTITGSVTNQADEYLKIRFHLEWLDAQGFAFQYKDQPDLGQPYEIGAHETKHFELSLDDRLDGVIDRGEDLNYCLRVLQQR